MVVVSSLIHRLVLTTFGELTLLECLFHDMMPAFRRWRTWRQRSWALAMNAWRKVVVSRCNAIAWMLGGLHFIVCRLFAFVMCFSRQSALLVSSCPSNSSFSRLWTPDRFRLGFACFILVWAVKSRIVHVEVNLTEWWWLKLRKWIAQSFVGVVINNCICFSEDGNSWGAYECRIGPNAVLERLRLCFRSSSNIFEPGVHPWHVNINAGDTYAFRSGRTPMKCVTRLSDE